MTAPESTSRVVRHPVRGGFAGLAFGLGVALLAISFSVIALGTLAPIVITVLGVVLGVVLALVLPPMGGGRGG